MEIIAIVPTKYLKEVAFRQRTHLILAHIVESDASYAKFYRNLSRRGDTIILDNSDYELPGNGYTPDDLYRFAEISGANVIMAPETYRDGMKTAQQIKDFYMSRPFGLKERLQIFGTIHGKTNEEILECHNRVVDFVDWVGLSCRLDPQPASCNYWTSNDSMNQSIYRNAFVHWMRPYMSAEVKYHLLGMNHPYELAHYSTVPEIYSNDTSCAFVNAVVNKDVSNIFSYKKPQLKLDFNFDGEVNFDLFVKNLRTIETFAKISDWRKGAHVSNGTW